MSGLTIGSLFSGIGGLELGLERGIGEGCRTVWQVELSEYCRTDLTKNFPRARRYGDIRNVGRTNLSPVDIICGGFPCQPHSHAGKLRGTDDERYLWDEYARIVGDLRPRYVVVENVANILADGTALTVLGDLAVLGYDAEWSVVSACAVGAPHTRERLFILADSYGVYGKARIWSQQQRRQNANESRMRRALSLVDQSTWLEDPSPLYRVDDGIPLRVERNTALGNAVVPQVAEVVGRLIAEREKELRSVA